MALGGCGGGASPANDGGPADASDAADAAIDLSLVCADAAPPEAPDAATPTGPQTCGGDVAVAGLTPYGPFVATNVRAMAGFADCNGFSILLDDEIDGVARDDEITLSVWIPRFDTTKPFVGMFEVMGAVESKQMSRNVPTHVELTGGEAFNPDGGVIPPQGVGPRGLIIGRIDMDTGCGHVVGTFSVPICTWSSCVTI